MRNKLANPFNRRLIAAVLSLALFAAFPALASAQTLSPTDEQYECGTLGVTGADGAECEPKDENTGGEPNDDGTSTLASPSGDGNSGSGGDGTLPFTGLDVWLIAAIGAGLLGIGFTLRRTAGSSRLSG